MQIGVDYIGIGIGAVIFNKEGKVFLAKRGKKARNEQGKWECPGGGLEFGESFEHTLIREMKEEYGIDIEVIEQLAAFNHLIPEEKQHWVALAFICTIKKGTPKILEPEKCEEIGLFTIDDMKKMPLTIATGYRLKQILDELPRKNLRGIPASWRGKFFFRLHPRKSADEVFARKNKKYPDGLPFVKGNSKIITICSSASFYKEVLEIEKKLKKIGFKVKIPKTANTMKRNGNFNVSDYKTWYRNESDYKKKTALMNGHFKKVLEADAILVVNNEKNGISGYIGGNALMEMTIAYCNKKPIFLWNKITSSLSVEEEVKGLSPIVIEQNVAKIIIK